MPAGLRADARANHDRLLEVAAAAFAADGPNASLKAIAAQAGVGIGTLYRRFPRRGDLVEAVYRAEADRLAAVVPELLKREPALDALRSWMEAFVDYTLTKQGMSDALPAILAARDGLRAHSRQVLATAVGALIKAGRTSGVVRADVDAGDVLMALGGITLISGHEGERDLASRLIRLLIHGLRAAGV